MIKQSCNIFVNSQKIIKYSSKLCNFSQTKAMDGKSI